MIGRAKILVVDDSRAQLEHLVEVLSKEGYLVETAGDGRSAVRQAHASPPDLVLLDMILPDMDGREVLRILKAKEGFIPIILLSVKSDLDSRVEGIRLGADDFLAKPFAEPEILAHVDAMLRIKSLQDTVREQKRELEKLSTTDGLTRLANHRHFQEELRREFSRAQRYGSPLSLIMMDLDHFKLVNDRHGHPFGDMVLQETAELVGNRLRDTDLPARYGGEEFAIILPNTPLSGAFRVAERILRDLNEHVFEAHPRDRTAAGGPSATLAAAGSPIAERVTASFGVASFPSPQITSADLLIQYADAALYRAKTERNAVALYPAEGLRQESGRI